MTDRKKLTNKKPFCFSLLWCRNWSHFLWVFFFCVSFLWCLHFSMIRNTMKKLCNIDFWKTLHQLHFFYTQRRKRRWSVSTAPPWGHHVPLQQYFPSRHIWVPPAVSRFSLPPSPCLDGLVLITRAANLQPPGAFACLLLIVSQWVARRHRINSRLLFLAGEWCDFSRFLPSCPPRPPHPGCVWETRVSNVWLWTLLLC